MPPTDPTLAMLLGLADALKKWLDRSPEARTHVQAIAQWLVEVSRTPSAVGPGSEDRRAPDDHAPASPTLPDAPPSSISTAPAVPSQTPERAAPALRPKPISGPRIVAPAEPILDAEVAAAALATGLGGSAQGGGLGPRHPDAQAGPIPQPGSAIEIPLDLIARRCRIKSDSCGFAIARNRDGFDPHKPTYDRLRAEADTVQPCYLWAIQRDTEFLEEWVLETAQGCYANLAEAADLAHAAPADPAVLELLSEAQGAIFDLLQGIEQARGDDRDQRTAWAWLRQRVERDEASPRVLDAARAVDPSAWRGLQARLSAARERLDAQRKGLRARRQALKTLTYHADRIADAHEGEDMSHDWRKITDACAAFLAAGGMPSDPELGELLAPIAERFPESLLQRDPIAAIMPFLDERLTAAEDRQDDESAAPARRVTEELLKARELLRGKVVVLIGGKCRHKSKRLIERELELKELRWISSDPHESIAPFEPEIARPDVGAVLLMIRWASHSYEGVKDFCLAHDKPYVRVPAGYNPNQLAHQVLVQQGERLAREAARGAA